MPDSLQALHSAHQARVMDVRGKPLPLGYGDFEGEVAAIEGGLGILAMEAGGVLLVRGPDAEMFLTGLTTNDVKGLEPGMARHNLLCATRGKILHHIVVARAKAEDYIVLSEPGEGDVVAKYLDHYHIREDLQLGTVELVRVDLLGPETGAALQRLGVSPQSGAGTFAGGPLLAPRLDMGAVSRVMALVPAGAAPALVESLLAGSAKARLVGMEALDEARLWVGIPRFGVDYGVDHLPAEAGLYDHISFDKGCYVGQEIHARMHYRGHPNRKLATVDIPAVAAESMAVGGELFLAGAAVGALTSLGRQAREGRRRGIAMLRYRILQDWPRLAASADGAAEIATLPLASDLGAGRQ